MKANGKRISINTHTNESAFSSVPKSAFNLPHNKASKATRERDRQTEREREGKRASSPWGELFLVPTISRRRQFSKQPLNNQNISLWPKNRQRQNARAKFCVENEFSKFLKTFSPTPLPHDTLPRLVGWLWLLLFVFLECFCCYCYCFCILWIEKVRKREEKEEKNTTAKPKTKRKRNKRNFAKLWERKRGKRQRERGTNLLNTQQISSE